MPDFNDMSPEQMQKMMEEMRKKENEGLTPEEIEKRDKEREMNRRKNKKLIEETLKICEAGCYEKDGKTIPLGLSPEQMTAVEVLLPQEVDDLPDRETEAAPAATSCENKDALTLALEKTRDPAYGGRKILLLNLASAVRPGGGVRDGMNGQEENLCQRSTLLMSLESDAAKPYYDYNNELHTHLGSDGVILTPDVVVFRDENGELMDTPFTISVLTCAAPNVRFGYEGKTEDEYQEMLQQRIDGILKAAVSLGYEDMILGAFGCGAFKNDASLVADDFVKALSGPTGRGLAHADFAVLATPGKEYNYNEFSKRFS